MVLIPHYYRPKESFLQSWLRHPSIFELTGSNRYRLEMPAVQFDPG